MFQCGIDVSVKFKLDYPSAKKIIGVMSKVPFDSHTGVLFKEQEILKFSDIC